MTKVKKEDMSLFFKVLNETPEESKIFVTKSLEIVHEIMLLLEERKINQKGLAEKLGKTEAEISKWLSGSHNFTIRTIAAIEAALNEEVLVTPHKIKSDAFKYTTKIYKVSSNVNKTKNAQSATKVVYMHPQPDHNYSNVAIGS
ncbi:MAG: helix-turn-helix transcriptional regulator [Cyclobacteriaceae bacterium]|jgi:transcriptional regulator with XRE-family HTH domain|nr:helix-turn-helix transcriptional regulator [Cytophagales bacterium]MCZ8327056.1 helix-turn-helix transcriptional regulator [Cyclobacteriaceae bacterium]